MRVRIRAAYHQFTHLSAVTVVLTEEMHLMKYFGWGDSPVASTRKAVRCGKEHL